MSSSLMLPILGVLAFGWLLFQTPIPLPDSRPIIAMDKIIKNLRSKRAEELRASTAGPSSPPSHAVTSAKPADFRTPTTSGGSGRSVQPPSEKGSPAEAYNQQDQVIQSHDSNVNDHAAGAASLQEAAAKGDRDAPVRLANMYFTGEGVPRSCEQALALLRTAASKPNVRARNRLAAVYAVGICVQRDRVQAYRWLALSLAVDPDNVWAKQNRALTWQQMTPEERNIADGDQ